MIRIKVSSNELVRLRTKAEEAGGVVNPTTGTIRFAFLAEGVDPVAADWKDATWETATINGVVHYYGRIKVPSSIPLAKGVYKVWVEVVLGSETVVDEVDTLAVE